MPGPPPPQRRPAGAAARSPAFFSRADSCPSVDGRGVMEQRSRIAVARTWSLKTSASAALVAGHDPGWPARSGGPAAGRRLAPRGGGAELVQDEHRGNQLMEGALKFRVRSTPSNASTALTPGDGQWVFPTPGRPRRRRSPSAPRAGPASSRSIFRSMDGWKSKSNCSRLFSQGKRASFNRLSTPHWWRPRHSASRAWVRKPL
jgi:hypothetical protein